MVTAKTSVHPGSLPWCSGVISCVSCSLPLAHASVVGWGVTDCGVSFDTRMNLLTFPFFTVVSYQRQFLKLLFSLG